MEAWLTGEWQRNSAWQIFLRPFSWLFALLVSLRRAAYRLGLMKTLSVGVPVIIVGNISVGGTGKTPLVLALVAALKAHGKHCGIVTRGYQRGAAAAAEKVVQVAPSGAQGVAMSDEAVLLARRAGIPVFVGADRVDAAQALLRHDPQINVIVSDDGLQHYALHRDVEICIVDGARGFGNGAMLPAGPLREPVSRMDTVDIIVVSRQPGGAGGIATPATSVVPVYETTLGNEQFVNLTTGRQVDPVDAKAIFTGARVHAIAGTGHPQRFFAHLVSLGLVVTRTQAFPDHHNYRAADMPGTDAEVILMTEKDAVKCDLFADERMWFMRVDAQLPEPFTDFILNKLSAWKA